MVSDAGTRQPRGPGQGARGAESEPGYDPVRARARLALIEQQVKLARATRVREDYLARPPVPDGIPVPWARALSEAEADIADASRQVEALAPLAGDPETVTDEHGTLPAQRRERFLGEFAAKVNAEVSGLHQRLLALRAELRAATGRKDQAALQEELSKGSARLAYLQTLPPFTAADMCSECPSPKAWHDTVVTFCLETGAILSEPCPAWPEWNKKLIAGALAVHEMLQGRQAPSRPRPRPQPLEVIAAGAPVEEVIARLTAVQAAHPGAQVREGKGGLEIWPAPAPGQPAPGG